MDIRAVYRAERPRLREVRLDRDLLNGKATSWREERKRLTAEMPRYVDMCDGSRVRADRPHRPANEGPSKAQLRADATALAEQFRARALAIAASEADKRAKADREDESARRREAQRTALANHNFVDE